jgi:hypothetical protein
MQGGVPFQCSGLPWVNRGNFSTAQAADEIDEEDDLYGSEKDGRIGDMPVERDGRG